MPETRFTDRDDIPKPDGDARNIRLSGAMAEHNTTLYFKGSARDMAQALRAIEYHAHEAHDGLSITASINEKTSQLQVTAAGTSKTHLADLVEFTCNATGCDLGISCSPTYMDAIKTTDKGHVRGHKYHPLAVVALADKELAENTLLARAVMKTIFPAIKKYAQEEDPGLKLTRQDNGDILVEDSQTSDSQAAALAEARNIASALQSLFPERIRTIS